MFTVIRDAKEAFISKTKHNVKDIAPTSGLGNNRL